jgi:shikimate kinase
MEFRQALLLFVMLQYGLQASPAGLWRRAAVEGVAGSRMLGWPDAAAGTAVEAGGLAAGAGLQTGSVRNSHGYTSLD